MIRGDLITGSTGMVSIREVNKSASDIKHRIISEFYALKKESQKQPKYKDLIKKWLITKAHLSPETVRTYENNVNYYYSNGLPNGCSISRVNSVRRDWNVFARWCIGLGYDIEKLEGSTESEGRLRVFSDSELSAILDIIKPKDLNDCFRFGFLTGARRKEYCAPKKEWLRQNNDGGYYLQVVKKGGYKRIVRVNEQAVSILEGRNWAFWNYTKGHLTTYFKIWARRAGVSDAKTHDLRRTFGFNLLNSGTDIAIVARLLGISVKVADKHYTPLLTSNISDFKL